MANVSEETCRSRTGEILEAIGELRDAFGELRELMARHFGEHNGLAKAEARSTSRIRRVAAITGIVFGGFSLVGLAVTIGIRLAQLLGD